MRWRTSARSLGDRNLKSDLDAMSSAFGPRWWTPPVFHSHEVALRFELAQGEFWIDRLETAKHRALTIVDAVLGQSSEVHLGVARHLSSCAMNTEEHDDISEALTAYGLPGIATFTAEVAAPTEHEDIHTWFGVTRLSRAQVNRVIWAAIAGDFGYLPDTPGSLYILNADHDILIHPYDDRGMDVIATSRTKVQSLYDEYGHWLLDHDRQRMDEVFRR